MRKLIWTTALLVMSSCGDVRLNPNVDMAADLQLTAIGPTIANTGDLMTLEGTFGDTVTVQFPGGASANATLLGKHRATVAVPADAAEGDLTVSTGGATLGPIPFRRAPFTLGLGIFTSSIEQPGGGRQAAAPIMPRSGHTSVVIGNHVFVVGGINKSTPLNSVEWAMINADGSLGPFSAVPEVTLTAARYAHNSVVIGGYLYVIGGFDNTNALNSVERAPISSNGSLGPFAIVPSVTLMAARQGHTTAVIGDNLYVVGGSGSGGYLNSVERATIHSDGSLDSFTSANVTMSTARGGHTSAVVGGYLYVIGGFNNQSTLGSIERAAINGEGLLEPFMAAPGTNLVTPRNNHASLVLGKNLYILGGIGPAGALTSIEQATIDGDSGLGMFATMANTVLPTVSSSHTPVVIGSHVYVFGGLNSNGLNDFARASINADGSLRSFAALPITQVTPRNFATTVVIGQNLYVIGGSGGGGVGALKSIEQATINADGSLGQLVTSNSVLTVARSSPTSAVIGNYLYVISGGPATVERAPINADGSLGPFAIVPGVTLMAGRNYASSVVVGNNLYVIGGFSTVSLASVERATINPDGSLTTFTPVTQALLTARYGALAVVLGRNLYVLGGINNSTGPVTNAERATLAADGSLATTFAVATAATMPNQRRFSTAAVVGDYLYLFGGVSLGTIERSKISTTGLLGAFTVVPSVTLTAPRAYHTTSAVGNYLYTIGGTIASDPVNSIERTTITSDAP